MAEEPIQCVAGAADPSIGGPCMCRACALRRDIRHLMARRPTGDGLDIWAAAILESHRAEYRELRPNAVLTEQSLFSTPDDLTTESPDA
jgi:hypothetical protein